RAASAGVEVRLLVEQVVDRQRHLKILEALRREPRTGEVVARRQVERCPRRQVLLIPSVVTHRIVERVAGSDRVQALQPLTRVASLTRDRERVLRVARVEVTRPRRLGREVRVTRCATAAARDADDVATLDTDRRPAVRRPLDLYATALLERLRSEQAHRQATAAVQLEVVARRDVEVTRPVRL